jgi:tight adherence protein B
MTPRARLRVLAPPPRRAFGLGLALALARWRCRLGKVADSMRARWRPPPGDVAPALEAVAKAVAAGRSLSAATAEVGSPPDPTPSLRARPGPFAALLGRAAARNARGTPLADALAAEAGEVDRVRGLDGVEARLGLAVLELAARHGGAPAMSLERAALSVRQRQAALGERRAQSAQARLSALVLTVLPIAFAAWTVAGDPRARGFVLGSPLGWACLSVGLGANAVGWWWMRRVISAGRGWSR